MPSPKPRSRSDPSHGRTASFFSFKRAQRAFGDSPSPEELIGKGVRFVKRIHKLRVIGLSIGFFCVAAGFLQNPVGWPLWALLIFHGYIWPHVAYRVALNSKIPYRTERMNLVADTGFGGFWIIAMLGSVFGVLIGLSLLDFRFAPESDLYTVVACLPMLALYPLALGKSTYDMSKKLAERSREFETVSQRDGLTGLLNRRYWESLLIEEFDACHEKKRSSCLLLLDIDHFKNINDTHGHLVGDEVLKNFSLLLKENLRTDDLIGRYGGEEFVVILQDISLREAETLAARLIEQVRQHRNSENMLWGCTI